MRVKAGREPARSVLQRDAGVASDETVVHIEGTKAFHPVFRCAAGAVHHAAPTRDAHAMHEIMDRRRPAVWLLGRCSVRVGHVDRQQTTLEPLARGVAGACEVGADTLAPRLGLWLDAVVRAARPVIALAASKGSTERRTLGRPVDDNLAAPAVRGLSSDIRSRHVRPRAEHRPRSIVHRPAAHPAGRPL